jgi:tRNA(Ile)-lysidine synthase
MRLMRGSGISGLAAMRSASRRGVLRLHRPLLPVSRAGLRATLGAFGQEWIEDPSNEQPRFARSRIRRLVTALGEAPRLAAMADEFARLDALVDAAAARLSGALVSRTEGEVRIERTGFRAAPEAVAHRLLRNVIRDVGAAHFTPRSDRLARSFVRLRSDEPSPAFTLGGCRFKTRGNAVVVTREGQRRGFPKPAD